MAVVFCLPAGENLFVMKEDPEHVVLIRLIRVSLVSCMLCQVRLSKANAFVAEALDRQSYWMYSLS